MHTNLVVGNGNQVFMAKFFHTDLFSIRRRLRENRADSDVYLYDKLPESLRVQLEQIFLSSIGVPTRSDYSEDVSLNAWQLIRRVLKKEHSRHVLSEGRRGVDPTDFPHLDVIDYFKELKNTDLQIDIIEICCYVIEEYVCRKYYYGTDLRGKDPDFGLSDPRAAIDEINFRMRRAAFGYQYADGYIIRVDDELTHLESILPAIHFLGSDPAYKMARDEFFSAHAHYRAGEHADC
jgi:hypothetical protein